MFASAKKLAERESVFRPALIRDDDLGPTAKAVALVLHGGQVKSVAPATARQVAVLRLLPVARNLASIGSAHGLAVYRLRFRFRGWNGGTVVTDDVRWGVEQIRARHGDVPIVLVGHSMGGRAALLAADAPGVVGVLGLAPWVVPGDAIDQLVGRRLLVLHGPHDRMTSAKASQKLVELVRGLAPIRDGGRHTEATFIGLRGTGHAMLRRLRVWNALSAAFVLHAAVGTPPTEPLAAAIQAGFASQ